MTKLFLSILNMSLSASWLVLTVLALRFLLRKTPKWINVLLWGLVAIRLLCPFTLESTFSLIPSAEVVSPEIMLSPTPQIQTGIPAVNQVINPVISESFAPEPLASANPLQILIPVSANIWLLGVCMMLLYTLITYLRLRRRVRMAIRVRGNLYLSEFISSPFVLGILRPRIYLPYHMTETDRTHVIAHERAHIRRRDHWWKPLGFLLLTLHWFNPLMWTAYILLCRDIELACDEKVIHQLGTDDRADYSQALLHCSVSHRPISACPLAFGEVGVKIRVKNVLSYKKPAFWVISLCLILVVIVSVCFLTDPLNDDLIQQVINQDSYTITSQESKNINLVIQKAWLPEDCLTPEGHIFEEKEIVPYFAYADNVLYLKHVGYKDETKEFLTFTFDFVTESPEDGKLLLPYQVSTENGQTVKTYNCDVLRNEVWDNSETYSDAAYLLIPDSGNSFCVNVRREIYEKAGHHIAFMLTDFNELRYEEGTPKPSSESDWPITMTLYDVSRTRAMLTFHYSDTLASHGLQISESYTLEQQNENTWQELPATVSLEPIHEVNSDDFDPYDAWSSLDLEAVYGRLPDGTYRIKKEITRTDDSGSNETIPFYAEFTIGGSAGPYVTCLLEDITPTGATLNIQENTKNSMDLIYNGDEGFWMEVYQDGQWHSLESTTFIEPIFADQPRYIYALHISSTLIELDWSNNFGQLSPGTYRIAREVTYTGGSAPQVCTAYAEFTIPANIGIDVVLDRITPNGISIGFLIDEDVPQNEYFFAGAGLQLRRKDTRWEDILPLGGDAGGFDLTATENSGMTFLWGEAFHTLSEGSYRIQVAVRQQLSDGTEKIHTLYKYFDPTTYAWDISMEVTGLSGSPGDLSIHYDTRFPQNLPGGSITEYPYFRLHKREHNQWTEIEPRTPYSYYDQYEHEAIRLGSERTTTTNLTAIYGKLSKGTYRLVQWYTRHYPDGSTDNRPVYAIFTLDRGFDVSLGTVTLEEESPVNAQLVYKGQSIAAVSNTDALEQLYLMFQNAIVADPPTQDFTFDLEVIFTLADGTSRTVKTTLSDDLYLLQDVYYDYGPDDARETLLRHFGITFVDPEILSQLRTPGDAQRLAQALLLVEQTPQK